jgi:hypothetical protein
MRWKRHESLRKYICVYCNNLGNQEDHIPSKYSYYVGIGDFIRVRCCSRCNRRLSNRPLASLEVRRAYLSSLGYPEYNHL